MYVIVRDDGKYVTRPGSEQSYTKWLENAQTFPTREEADRNKCPGNEIVLSVAYLIRQGKS